MRVSHKKPLLAALAVLLLIYGFWQARDLLRGPRINLDRPSEGEIFTESLLEIKGWASEVVKFTLNGKPIFIDEGGNFSEKILLSRGINYIEIYGEDKFGHGKKIGRTVLLK